MEDWELLQLAALAVVALMGVRAWWQSGFWIPRYVHVTAAFMVILGYLLWRVAAGLDSPLAEASFWLFVVGLPIAVYTIFFLYGGATGFMRSLGLGIDFHAAMRRDDVKDIFLRHVPDYLSLPLEEIRALGPGTPTVKIRKGTDRFYKLHARSEPLDDPRFGALTAVNLRLEDHSEPRAKPPTAFTQILFAEDGTVVRNPLDYIS
jgi:hypothetical protein